MLVLFGSTRNEFFIFTLNDLLKKYSLVSYVYPPHPWFMPCFFVSCGCSINMPIARPVLSDFSNLRSRASSNVEHKYTGEIALQ